ncbi:cystathionine gamma-synthase [Rhodobacterales bacterium 52_120_T64]|nr:cystathionine gamma-synthase [Rhodobacterales bacterium 52_120_T64]
MPTPPKQLNLSPATRAVQALHMIDERTGAISPMIDLSSTYARDENYDPRQAYIYGRSGGQTVKHAEAVLASLEGGSASLLFASGMAAMVTLMETLESGDHVVAPQVMYHAGMTWIHRLTQKRGVEATFFDQTDPSALANAVRAGQTRIVWIESPTNPNWDVIDIAQAAEIAHAAGAILAVDCTTSPPSTTQALTLGADIVFHSATKYLNGHSDMTGGVLTCADTNALWDELGEIRELQGSVMAGFEAWLLIRGLRTLYLRYDRASANALTLAKHFQGHKLIENVLYPGLPSHPGHEIAKRQMTGGFGGMISILIKGGAAQAQDVSRFTQVFVPATSLGGVESLIEHRKAVEGPLSIVADNLIRLSIGIEDVNDLIADLEQALERAE